jgi:hypothetical protein
VTVDALAAGGLASEGGGDSSACSNTSSDGEVLVLWVEERRGAGPDGSAVLGKQRLQGGRGDEIGVGGRGSTRSGTAWVRARNGGGRSSGRRRRGRSCVGSCRRRGREEDARRRRGRGERVTRRGRSGRTSSRERWVQRDRWEGGKKRKDGGGFLQKGPAAGVREGKGQEAAGESSGFARFGPWSDFSREREVSLG